MGYMFYETPLGDAGYGVEDTCHEEGCEEQIDRGLDFLCGDQPGYASYPGCGRWFCGQHLEMRPPGVELLGSGLCRSCKATWERDHPEDADEAYYRSSL